MSDDLVKRLWLHDCEGVTREAADRIEELGAKLANVKLELNAAVKLLAAAGDGLRLMVRVEMAEDKLAKAVEALDNYSCDCGDMCEMLNGSCGDTARTTLAELKG